MCLIDHRYSSYQDSESYFADVMTVFFLALAALGWDEEAGFL